MHYNYIATVKVVTYNSDGQQVITISLRNVIEWMDFHFNPPGIIPYAS